MHVPLPATMEEQIASLRAPEPTPDALLADLARRRVEATRDRLVRTEGIPPVRLSVPDTPPGTLELALATAAPSTISR